MRNTTNTTTSCGKAYFKSLLVIENTAVSIPIAAYTCADKTGLGLSKRSLCCNSHVNIRDVCGKCGQPLTSDLIGKGYKMADKMIPLEEEAIKAIKPGSIDAILIKGTADKMPSVLDTDKKYWLLVAEDKKPDVQGREAYQLLQAGLEESGKVLIGSTIVRQKEYPVAIESVEGKLLCSFLLFKAQEKEVPELDYGTAKQEDVKQIAEFLNGLPKADLESIKDSYSENLLRLIQGEKVESIPEVKIRQVSNAKAMFVKN